LIESFSFAEESGERESDVELEPSEVRKGGVRGVS
jgi:hypothetical protein